MVAEGCWSTVICSGPERAALGNTSDPGWVLGCRLSIGHRGNHATDAETVPRADRRRWLEWNDAEPHAQSLIERNPCTASAPTPCLLFEGHPGLHWFAPSNGHATSARDGVPPPTGVSRPVTGDGFGDPTSELPPTYGPPSRHPSPPPGPPHHVSRNHTTPARPHELPSMRDRAVGRDRSASRSGAAQPVPAASVPPTNFSDAEQVSSLSDFDGPDNARIADGRTSNGTADVSPASVGSLPSDSVSDALDGVVLALGRLADAMRRG